MTNYLLLESQPENKYSKLVNNQKIVIIPEFTLECGESLYEVPVAFKTWGKLNEKKNNCMVICHALTGSSDISDWWGPLLGKGKAFDPTKFFIICLNSLGSPYGSASPMTKDPASGERYGPEFPLATIRDDVRIHKKVLDFLGVKQIAAVIGGSMGGMVTLEYPLILGEEYVRSVVALATSARHSAWCISWGEAQRQSIYSDPKYKDGYYDVNDGPVSGLAAARMSALLTYRSRNSFENRFARNDPLQAKNVPKSKLLGHEGSIPENSPVTPKEENWTIHNEGNKNRKHSVSSPSLRAEPPTSPSANISHPKKRPQTFFTAQSYLRYQGDKFIGRYDPNCYISVTRKLDTHDLSRDRYVTNPENPNELIPITMEQQLGKITQPSLIIGIASDGLFTLAEQEYLAKHIPNSVMYTVHSSEGHDAFLLEFMEINNLIIDFEEKHLVDILEQEAIELDNHEDLRMKGGPSLFGESEEVTNW
ncbi:homoserine O-acetyltransferase [Saccharomycopsis crataegensis]|uniref:Homoserine O-acetyltransferase n=1 Tax=Saccharomycopsis crataegensis TaxID=43959 RepID=A0AAV5QS94_9ASCO|nr:homoserine O-acetyltransferase [Saccharomycopsis crataegensis]